MYSQELCDNGIDDDGDGLIDCEDAECSPFISNIRNGDFEITQPGCNTGFSNFNDEAVYWDNAAGTAEFYLTEPNCTFNSSDFGGPGAVDMPASSGFNYAGYHGPSDVPRDMNLIIQEVVIQSLANPLRQGINYTLFYDIAQMISIISFGWEGDDEGGFKVFGIRTGVDNNSIDYLDCNTIENSPGVDLIGESEIITDSLTWHTQTNEFTAAADYDRVLFAICGHIYMGLDNVRINRAVITGTEPLCAFDTTVVKVLNTDQPINWTVDGARSTEIMGDLNDSIMIVSEAQDITLTIGVEGFVCDSTIIIPVTEVNGSAGEDVTICVGEDVILNATGGFNYQWINNVRGLDNTVNSTVNFRSTLDLEGENDFTVVVEGDNMCLDTASIKVTVLPIPEVRATASETPICVIDDLILKGEGTATSYDWDNGVLDGIPFLPNDTRTYTVIGTADNECTASDQILVEVVDRFIPAITIADNGPVCEGDEIIFSLESSIDLEDSPEYNWFQENEGGADVFLGNTTVISFNNINNTNGIYLEATTSRNCVEPQDIKAKSNVIIPEFLEFPNPIIEEDLILCIGDEDSLRARDLKGVADQFVWFRIEEDSLIRLVETENLSIAGFESEGEYIVQASNQFCERFSDTATVDVVDVFLEAQISCGFIFENGEVELSVNTDAGEVIWESDQTGNLGQEFTFKDQPEENSIYTVTGLKDGCEITDSVSVIVLRHFTIPRFFSPNEDGDNDVWVIDDIDPYPEFTIELINRWGVTVREWENDYQPWDGISKTGNPLPDGTYFYVIKVNFSKVEIEPITGYVTIIR